MTGTILTLQELMAAVVGGGGGGGIYFAGCDSCCVECPLYLTVYVLLCLTVYVSFTLHFTIYVSLYLTVLVVQEFAVAAYRTAALAEPGSAVSVAVARIPSIKRSGQSGTE